MLSTKSSDLKVLQNKLSNLYSGQSNRWGTLCCYCLKKEIAKDFKKWKKTVPMNALLKDTNLHFCKYEFREDTVKCLSWSLFPTTEMAPPPFVPRFVVESMLVFSFCSEKHRSLYPAVHNFQNALSVLKYLCQIILSTMVGKNNEVCQLHEKRSKINCF